MPTFAASSGTSGGGQVALYQIEQATAPRLGPYFLRTQSSTTHATTSEAFFDELKSSVAPGGTENLFMLRRGYKADGTTVAVSVGDRQRIASSVDNLTGGVVPGRAWGTAPADGELIEFHHTDPANQLRPAVLNGLRRCFFIDRVSLVLSSSATERDLTALVPWIIQPDQIQRVQYTTTGSLILPQDLPWAEPFEQGGHVWLSSWPDEFPSTLLITARRSYFTRVNGADSTTGPTADADLLDVTLSHAAAAAHIEGWKLFPAVLKAAADAGYQATQAMAAAEFTREVVVARRRQKSSWNLSDPFPGTRMLSMRTR